MPAKGHFGCSADKQDGGGRLLHDQTDVGEAVRERARGAGEGGGLQRCPLASFPAARPQTKSQKK